jgi:hypothetical protein
MPKNIDQVDLNPNLESETFETSEIPKTKEYDGDLNPRSNKPKNSQNLEMKTPLLHETREEFLRCKYCNKKPLSETHGNYDTVVGERENSCLYALDGFLYAKNSTRPNKKFLK